MSSFFSIDVNSPVRQMYASHQCLGTCLCEEQRLVCELECLDLPTVRFNYQLLCGSCCHVRTLKVSEGVLRLVAAELSTKMTVACGDDKA